jgi:SAM-dependent methyltransferase
MPESELEYKYWGKRASSYEDGFLTTVGSSIYDEITEWLARQFNSSDTVVELGCGTGLFSRTVAKSVKHLTATDLSPAMVRLSQEKLIRYDNVEIRIEDCYDTTFEHATFDAVMMTNLIHIVKSPLKVLRESNRILKPNGRVIIADVTGDGMSLLSKLGLIFRYLNNLGKPCPFNRNIAIAEITGIAKEAGFEIDECISFGETTKAICACGRKKHKGNH